MSKYTKAAKGQTCTLEGWHFPCSHVAEENDTTVLAHLPQHDAGTGQKCPDYLGADLCAAHHDYIDGRVKRKIDCVHDRIQRHGGRVMFWTCDRCGMEFQPEAPDSGQDDIWAKYSALRRTLKRREQQGVLPWGK